MILLDTDILIAHLRGVPAARSWLHAAHERDSLAVSVVTITELTGGMRSSERPEVWQLLSILQTTPVTGAIARTAGGYMRQYRRSHSGIGIADYLIAATVTHLGAELATLNVRHFPMFAQARAPFAIR